MKALFLIILFFVSINIFSQTDSTENKICKERGHVCSGIMMKTDLYCASYTIDTDSTTVLVYPACNYVEFTCSRCGNRVSEREKERRVVIWRKE